MPFPMASRSSRSHSRRRRRTCSPIRRSTRSGKLPNSNIAPPRSSRWTTRRGWRRSKQRSVGAPIGLGAWVKSHTRPHPPGRRAYTPLKSTSPSHGQRFSPPYALGWRIQRMWRVVARAGRLEAFKKTAAQDGAAREDTMAQRKSLNVNGKSVQITIDDPDMPLLYALRDNLALHGPRFGCGLEQCGACTVHVDGKAVRSCVTPLSSLTAQQKVVTLEGLGTPQRLHPVQRAFIEEQAVQCGYCINGMIMESAAFLARTKNPTEAQVKDALANNLCRCGTHARIVKAVMRAAGA